MTPSLKLRSPKDRFAWGKGGDAVKQIPQDADTLHRLEEGSRHAHLFFEELILKRLGGGEDCFAKRTLRLWELSSSDEIVGMSHQAHFLLDVMNLT